MAAGAAGPAGAAFYPFWSIGSPGGALSRICVWNFGNDIPGVTRQDFGRAAQYGTPDLARFGGTVISEPMANPQFSGSCSF